MSQQSCISDLTADRVLYRDLRPCDERLPGIDELRADLGLLPGYLPRKRDRDYARVIGPIAQAAQAERGGRPLRSCLVIGDTENDRLVATHLCALGELRTWGFIGVDRPAEAANLSSEGSISSANRWSLLRSWSEQIVAQGIDWPTTALLIDIDKTLLGPRGRTDGAIDDARAAGALAVAREYVGDDLDAQGFRAIYDRLCRTAYHPFTLDNQDYVVYTALLITVGTLRLAELDANLASGQIRSFAEVLATPASAVPAALAELHQAISARVAEGDPTPFKRFRRCELAETVARMASGQLTLCAELFALAGELSAQGALCIAASDKPAEASMPTEAQRAAGLLPLHWTPAVVC